MPNSFLIAKRNIQVKQISVSMISSSLSVTPRDSVVVFKPAANSARVPPPNVSSGDKRVDKIKKYRANSTLVKVITIIISPVKINRGPLMSPGARI